MPQNNPYSRWIHSYREFIAEGKSLPLGKLEASRDGVSRSGKPTVLILSPHPDDESIVGTLPLRLLRQGGCRVVNLAVTLGSKRERRAGRLAELTHACDFLGFELINADPDGLEDINPAGREAAPGNWEAAVGRVTGMIKQVQPDIVFLPHGEDWNKTHIGVHLLGIDALRASGGSLACWVIESEYWHPLYAPNLMVECSDEMLADQVAALAMHEGEVRRNPYHLSMPAWMHDNVRRGAECLGGQGEAAPDYLFAALYGLRRWESGAWTEAISSPRILSADASPLDLFSRQAL